MKRFSEMNESSAGQTFGRMPVFATIDRAFVEKMPWKKQLHPEFFDNETQVLHPVMQNKMKTMVNIFLAKVGIPKTQVRDIVFKGSLASYNYTPTSDIDLQIILKYNWEKNPLREPGDESGIQLERNWNKIRADYNKEHGYTLGKEHYPVEFFMQTPKTNTKTGSSSRWSVLHNAWVPGYKPNQSINAPPPKIIAARFKGFYDRVKNAYINKLKIAKLEAALYAKKELGNMAKIDRNLALHGDGTSPANLRADVESPENLAFKALKRTRLIAFIETEIAKSRENGLMDMKKKFDAKPVPFSTFTKATNAP